MVIPPRFGVRPDVNRSAGDLLTMEKLGAEVVTTDRQM
jgi:hypothetical protein